VTSQSDRRGSPPADVQSAAGAVMHGETKRLIDETRRPLSRQFRKELDDLPTLLAEGERVVTLARASMIEAGDGVEDGLLVVTDRRLIHYRRERRRTRRYDFPYSGISLIQTSGRHEDRITIFHRDRQPACQVVRIAKGRDLAPVVGDVATRPIPDAPPNRGPRRTRMWLSPRGRVTEIRTRLQGLVPVEIAPKLPLLDLMSGKGNPDA
jgi:hypothetical protein